MLGGGCVLVGPSTDDFSMQRQTAYIHSSQQLAEQERTATGCGEAEIDSIKHSDYLHKLIAEA